MKDEAREFARLQKLFDAKKAQSEKALSKSGLRKDSKGKFRGGESSRMRFQVKP